MYSVLHAIRLLMCVCWLASDALCKAVVDVAAHLFQNHIGEAVLLPAFLVYATCSMQLVDSKIVELQNWSTD